MISAMAITFNKAF